MIGSSSQARVTLTHCTHDRPVTNHRHSHPSLSLGVVFFALDRSVQSVEVVKASVRPKMMSDIGHRHISGNLTHRRWKGNCASTSDVPNLQHWVYDVAVAATECNQTQAHCACEAVIKCPALRHHCVGSVVRRSVGSGHPFSSRGDLHMRHHVLL